MTVELYVLESVLLGLLKRTSLRLWLLVIINYHYYCLYASQFAGQLLAHYFPLSFGGNPYDANDPTSHFSIIIRRSKRQDGTLSGQFATHFDKVPFVNFAIL